MSYTWTINTIDLEAAAQLARALELHPIVAQIMIGRGITQPEAARRWLEPELAGLPDPDTLPDMMLATERLAHAISNGERIALFGDYDVDGVSGTALVVRALRHLGAAPLFMLPSRHGEGYGLTTAAVEALHERGASLIVTVDNGTRSFAEVEHARSLGMDVIITDHHDASAGRPDAIAVVNPQLDEQHPENAVLSGCGVAFMLMLSLRRNLRNAGVANAATLNGKRLLDLVALGTIADIVPLTGPNRILVRHGLQELAAGERAGVRALMQVSRTSPDALTPITVAFQLAPRLNAAGRMGSAEPALNLLLTDDPDEAVALATELDRTNQERRQLESNILAEIDKELSAEEAPHRPRGLVLAGSDWHVGVLGIVASKLARRLNLPVAVFTTSTTPARGSARAPNAVNLMTALGSCADLLVRYGGHAQAAGMSIDPKRMDAFRTRFDQSCRLLCSETAGPQTVVDALVDPKDVSLDLVEQLDRLEPFGAGNPEPVLGMHHLDVVERRIVGKGHLKLTLAREGQRFEAIGFSFADRLQESCSRVSAAFVPQMNTWNGVTSIQLKLKDIQPEE